MDQKYCPKMVYQKRRFFRQQGHMDRNDILYRRLGKNKGSIHYKHYDENKLFEQSLLQKFTKSLVIKRIDSNDSLEPFEGIFISSTVLVMAFI